MSTAFAPFFPPTLRHYSSGLITMNWSGAVMHDGHAVVIWLYGVPWSWSEDEKSVLEGVNGRAENTTAMRRARGVRPCL